MEAGFAVNLLVVGKDVQGYQRMHNSMTNWLS